MTGLVDYLNEVSFINSTPTKSCPSSSQILDGLNHTDSPFREGLHILQKICSLRAILPASCGVLGELSFSIMWPVSSCGTADVYKGSLNEVGVGPDTVLLSLAVRPRRFLCHQHNYLQHQHYHFYLRQISSRLSTLLPPSLVWPFSSSPLLRCQTVSIAMPIEHTDIFGGNS